ncbi:Putative cytokinin riboside 5'-monophosphate phosphoribohydrolase [Actinosynnema sp. ALI-1.44]
MFCGSSSGRERHLDVASAVGRGLAERGIELVYGGGRIGTMGAVADGALAAGGTVIGVIPQSLVELEVAHHGLSELHVVADMHERKALMARLADAFVTLPGGAGTLEEMFEVWTWAQLGLHTKPLGLLDVDGYFGHLLKMVDHMVEEGFLKPAYRDMLLVEDELDRLLEAFRGYRPPAYKWVEEGPLC